MIDQRAVVTLEVEKNDRKYSFTMPIGEPPLGAPYGEAYDAAYEFLQEIVEMSQKAADRAKRKEVKVKTDDDKEEENSSTEA